MRTTALHRRSASCDFLPTTVQKNRIRKLLAEGKTVTRMLLFTGSPMVVEMMAATGPDFVIIDREHSVLDLGRAVHLIRTAAAAGDLFVDAIRRMAGVKD